MTRAGILYAIVSVTLLLSACPREPPAAPKPRAGSHATEAPEPARADRPTMAPHPPTTRGAQDHAGATSEGGAGSAPAPDPKAALALAREATKRLGSALKQALVHALEDGGPVHAVETCNLQAPEITAAASSPEGVSVRRVGTRLRNPKNAPDPWEAKVLAAFAQPQKPGTALEVREYWEVVPAGDHKELRYARSILAGPICLTCHGEHLADPLAKAIAERYPKDRATGYHAGDLRGIFSARVALPGSR